MGGGGLTPLQRRILELLSGTRPPWTLTGGAALAGFHLHHRTTRDLDLFWHGRDRLGPERDACIRRLRSHGLQVEVVQHDPTFGRLLVSDASERVVLDLVAEPVEPVEAPQPLELGSFTLLVDTPHEILVNKLCALLGRAELRDLLDVRALLDHGGDLTQALEDAPMKDAGFSAITLAWVLRGLPIEDMAEAAGLEASAREEIGRLRDDLVDRLVRGTRP